MQFISFLLHNPVYVLGSTNAHFKTVHKGENNVSLICIFVIRPSGETLLSINFQMFKKILFIFEILRALKGSPTSTVYIAVLI